ncbi:hypothetical protein [Flavobacterium rhizosphaerae]|uniref:Uncharacterized protein n=1 Tax=Flavobacterium rhizosphaerae TaxID=3163298 RepID=A0ABW8YSQ4_9FLAO
MKKSIFYAALLAVTGVTANAQQGVNQGSTGPIDGRTAITSTEKLTTTGSQYITEQYMPAKISGSDQVQLLRYNAFNDYFEINNPQEGKPSMLPKQAGVKISFVNNGNEYTTAEYVDRDDNRTNGYLKVISETPKVKIYKRERIYLQPGKIGTNSYEASKPNTYKQAKDEYYIQIGDAPAQYFRRDKDLEKLMPNDDLGKEVRNYIKKNDIETDEEAGLKQLGAYLNTIL